jgi:hypothetical protein
MQAADRLPLLTKSLNILAEGNGIRGDIYNLIPITDIMYRSQASCTVSITVAACPNRGIAGSTSDRVMNSLCE